MHIVILADPVDNQLEGVHFYTKNLIKNLLKLDKKNSYSFIHLKSNKFFKNTRHYIIKDISWIPGYGTIRKFILIPRLIKKLKPDAVIETQHLGPFNIPQNIKRAQIIHDLTPILFPHFHILNSVIMHKLFMNKIVQKSNLLIAVSKNTAKDIKKLFNYKNPIKIISPGILPPSAAPLPSPLKKPYLLYLGTIEPRKNLELLIRSFIELSLPHKLVLAGKIGWKSKKIIKLAHSHPNIILTGYLNEKNKAAYLKNAEAFIYPSHYEGFGLPPLEAMSYGTPVICSTGGSLKEIFNNYALMFNPNSKKELKSKITKLLNNNNLKESLSKKGQIYSQNFNWHSAVSKLIAEFNKL
ncbi:glycosyltransferase [Candidatus Peregrinibacteria bacterium]|nr:glycosyltransferase [Candidatus Peregrinibacteria bacterium]